MIGVALGIRRFHDVARREAEPGQRQQAQHHRGAKRRHLADEAEEREAGAAPQQDILRVADRRQQRTGVHRQRLKDDQTAHRQRRQFFQRDGERNDDKQRHVVGQKRRQQRGREHQEQRQPPFAMQPVDNLAANEVEVAADLNAFGQQHQPQQSNEGAAVDKPAQRRHRLRMKGEHRYAGQQQRMQETVFDKGMDKPGNGG